MGCASQLRVSLDFRITEIVLILFILILGKELLIIVLSENNFSNLILDIFFIPISCPTLFNWLNICLKYNNYLNIIHFTFKEIF